MSPVTSTRFWVRAMRASISRSMQLLMAQPEATTNDNPITVASSKVQSKRPCDASKKPPTVEMRLPKMMPGLVTCK